jgi:chromosome partitioning protein
LFQSFKISSFQDFFFVMDISMVITICNQKGGTGKSTIAVHLAVCFAMGGQRTLLIDTDPQQSALAWKADRPAALARVQVIGLPAPNLHKEIDAFKADYEVILIDGGGRITATARAACAVADFIIIPARPSKPDLLSTKEFLRTVIEEIRAMRPVAGGILVTQMQAGTVVGKAALDEIHTLGYPVFDTIMHTRVVYQEAMAAGMSVLEYAGDSKAAQETRALFDEVREAIA